ncbi:MAG: RluA family pseudouridine synthase [Planctomycetota bacterium]
MPPATYTLLHRDDTLAVVDKAPGVLTVGRPGSRERCLLDDLRRDGIPVAPVHRLDRDTSGVLLLCLDKSRRAELEALFRERKVDKSYLAIVAGVPQSREAVIEVPITDTGARAKVDRRGRRAVSRYEVLETFSGRPGSAALVRVVTETGRHHQVRVHMAYLGHPLLGDTVYARKPGEARKQAPRAMLHADSLAFRHPVTGKRLTIEAEPPEDFAACIAALRG